MKSFTQKLFKVAFLFSLFFTLFSAQAQAPQKMSYQAVVRNAANTLVANTAVGVKISVLQTSASGTSVYSERHTPTTNANGLATFEIGGGTVLAGTFTTINWANGPYFIKTETDPTGGTNYTIAGTSQLASVPYALFAANGGTPGPQGIQGVAGATGAQGIPGTAGAAGTPGKNTAALTTVEPPGANCATGGNKLQFGTDTNGNNTLDPAEINAALTRYVCNGATGATGAQGPAGTATNAWGLLGTAGTTAANFIGTTDNKPVVIKSNNKEVARANQNGTLYVGQENTDLLIPSLAVKGEIIAYDGGKFKASDYNENGYFESVTVTKNGIQATTIDPSNIPDPAPLTINPNGGNIGIQTGAITPINKVQIGNTPTFIGNDIAIGNGAQQMALTQTPTASTFYTNTNFALMPAGGTGNVGIGTDTPSSKLQVVGSVASEFKFVSTDYTPTSDDYIIYANMQYTTGSILTITLPSPAFCIGRIYCIKGTQLPLSTTPRCSYDVEGLNDSFQPYPFDSGFVAIKNHLNQPITYLYVYRNDPALLDPFSDSYFSSRTFIYVQSVGNRWIVLGDNFVIDQH
jgi:hypothetical protein